MTDTSPDTAAAAAAPANAQKRRGGNKRPPQAAERQPRPVNPVLERLFELYPALFGAKFLPLKLGVFQDLLARHPEDFKKDELKLAMGQHARSTRYLESVADGHPRHDLDGQPVEPVAPEHVHHAILELFRRRQARTRDDLRPRLRARLVQAVEASGLSREDYAARVRVQDEATNALLDDAMAELGAQAARREALFRAFEASGKTEAEFADMYGMKTAEVSAMLARVRRDQAAPVTTPAA
ncbi:MAG: ProQ/FINO family protein [Polaromonas sp.]|nr:ProQ/FINO family protein [Polaromonas sp.]